MINHNVNAGAHGSIWVPYFWTSRESDILTLLSGLNHVLFWRQPALVETLQVSRHVWFDSSFRAGLPEIDLIGRELRDQLICMFADLKTCAVFDNCKSD